ncbi:hypothetical protein [Bacillus cereus]|uniref:hypothetical protein n=1 Tax=Bacillus cereus TaxID=1396 RepID=UPI000B4B698B|nr:hypothetical protein [Bacillus cereus]
MKGRFKDNAKRITLIVLFLIISILTISLISGRIGTEQIILLKKDGLNVSLPLDQQLEFFEKKEISKGDMKSFKGTVVTDLAQLKDKRLIYELKPGSPVPLAALMEPNGAGQFAALMPKGKTVHLLPEAKLGLPPVQEGDFINIGLSYKEKQADDTEGVRTGVLMRNLKIFKIIENSIYVEVDLEQDLVLSTASQLGTFIYQIPGQNSGALCDPTQGKECKPEDSKPTIIQQKDIFDAIINGTYSGLDTETVKKAIENPIENADEISNKLVKPDKKEKASKEEKDAKDDKKEKDKSNNIDDSKEKTKKDKLSGGESNEQ